MSSEKRICIRALKFASTRDTFTIQQLFDHLELTDEQKWRFAVQVSNKEIFYHSRTQYLREYQEGKKIDLSMSVEDEFRLLEYTELSEARTSSRQATIFASAALIVSIIATISSIWFSYQTSNSEINYPSDVKEQLTKISDAAVNLMEELRRENSSNKSIQPTAKASAD